MTGISITASSMRAVSNNPARARSKTGLCPSFFPELLGKVRAKGDKRREKTP